MIFTFEQCCGAGAGGAEIIWGPEAVAEKKIISAPPPPNTAFEQFFCLVQLQKTVQTQGNLL